MMYQKCRKIAFLLVYLFAEDALAQDLSRERVDYLSKLSDLFYSQHERNLIFYSRGLALTTYCDEDEKSVLFDINWFPVELYASLEKICSLQCDSNVEKAILRNLISKQFYGVRDGIIDFLHVHYSDSHETFCSSSENLINFLFGIVNDRADEWTRMGEPPDDKR